MAALPSVTPSYGAQKQSSPKVQVAQYNDGYMQRLKWGMNVNPRVWNLTWTNISETDADTLDTFFVDRVDDGASFDWEPLDESAGTTYKFICLNWTKSIPFKNRATVQATFQQVFEP